MGRLAIIGVVLVAFMVMAEATVFVETNEELDNQYSSGRQCRQELSRQRLHSCQRYLQRGGRGLGELILRRGGYEEASLENCCRELRQVNERCRCQAIRQAADRAQRQGDWEDDDDDDRRGRDQDYDRRGRDHGYDRRGRDQDYDRRGRDQDYGRGGYRDDNQEEYDRQGRSQEDYGRQGSRGDEQRQREIRQRAQNLPQMCRLNRPQQCQIRGSYD